MEGLKGTKQNEQVLEEANAKISKISMDSLKNSVNNLEQENNELNLKLSVLESNFTTIITFIPWKLISNLII